MRPPWIRAKFPSGKGFTEIREILQEYRLQTVCDAALCPNIGECYNQKTATFLILGGVCTRKCGYCAVTKGTAARHWMKKNHIGSLRLSGKWD
ncbi:hypothetical protein [Candidatus Kuenenia stuttgartiensis]|uniref:hypothetical protein n=1 Tax=Kuenenia stuttgartiensis TaxID=174633 RepID=UPI001B8D40C3|nr:hypothetical protein [Candidatus Kuenenia stuttgartiensis]